MELRVLNTFTRVAELKSFSKAAERLGYNQSTVTIQIKQLEDELNTRLFDRMGHTIMLTNSGQALLPYAKELLLLEQKAKSVVTDNTEIHGVLRLGLIESVCTSIIPEILPMYHRLYPNVELHIITEINYKLIDMLKTNEIDLAFMIDDPITSPDIITGYSFNEPIVFVASKDFDIGSEDISYSDLVKMPFLLTEKNTGYRRVLDNTLERMGLAVKPFVEIGDTTTIVSLLKHNIGVSLLPEFCVSKGIKNGELKTFNVENWNTSQTAQLIYNRYKWKTPPMDMFIRLVSENVK